MSGLLGVAGVAGNFIGVPMAAYSASNEEADLAKFFGSGSIEAAKRNPAVRKKMKELDERWEGAVWESLFSLVGGAIAGAVLGFLAPVPIPGLSIIGMIAGGFAGSSLYGSMCEKQAEDPLVINEQIIKMREAGEIVPANVVFAALAANVSGKAGENVDKTLKRYTGKEVFNEVLGNPASVARLSAMMNNPAIDSILRVQTGMSPDPQNPNKSVAEQYAELINSGKLHARDLLLKGAGVEALLQTVQNPPTASLPAAPKTPTQGRADEQKAIQ